MIVKAEAIFTGGSGVNYKDEGVLVTQCGPLLAAGYLGIRHCLSIPGSGGVQEV